MIKSKLKYNSSLRFIRNYFDEWIAYDENRKKDLPLRIWPAFYPDFPVQLDKDDKLNSFYYKIYNPVGNSLIDILILPIEKIVLIQKRFEVHSDMLKVVLNLRCFNKQQ